MPTVKAEVVIDAPHERVWEFVTALRYLQVWMDDVEAVSGMSAPEPAAGTTFSVTRRGRRDAESWTVVDWSPPNRMRVTDDGRPTQIAVNLEPDDNRTRVSLLWESSAWRGSVPRLLPAFGQRQAPERSLARLKELIDLNQDIKLLHGMGDE